MGRPLAEPVGGSTRALPLYFLLAFVFATAGVLSGCSNSPSRNEFDASSLGAQCGATFCGDGEVCWRDRCVAACGGDTDCTLGDRCTGGGFCRLAVPPGEGQLCVLDTQCDSRICEGGSCVLRDCTGDADCFDGEGCGADGFCVAGATGGDDEGDMGADVPDGDVDDTGDEDGGDRVPECLINEDCGDETIRCEDGACVPLAICQADEDCFEDQYCHRGQCRPWCTDDLDCRGEQTCVDERCEDAPEDAACRSTDDCEPCESCIYGVCTVSEFFCRDDEDCGYDKVCRNGFCAYECATGAECPTGQSCVDLVCLDDPPVTTECVFNEECSEGTFCINGRCHIACETHSECGYREMCDHGVCQPDRRPGAECLLNAHCTEEVSVAECVDAHCALPCFVDDECRTGACEVGFCTR